ncbi:hypothetical protein ANTHELSMS3_04659 (plasmid) [Antarctobacter heliothermus]|uniref:Uncharacterized protein n=1 Tax=Antarctobacter heliothermus TaxID=74033 RepID=A0A222EBJ4_9RHOB|nr:hypothetical protein [Antarctobacter heliothermus]ASP23557.1 hypothetical protein ANTHELSMS3_04659 [Antarctobacter heliothermus]
MTAVAIAAGPEWSGWLAGEAALLPGITIVESAADADLLAIAPDAAAPEDWISDALAAGAAVILTAPADLAELANLMAADAPVDAPGRLGHSEAGRHLLDQLSDPGVGAIHSLYLSVRTATEDAGSRSFEALLWDAVCLIDDCLDSTLAEMHVDGGAMFGQETDSAVGIARTANGTVVTIDVACCLPPALCNAGATEAEIEIMGAEATLRAATHARRSTVWDQSGVAAQYWGDDAMLSMINAWTAGRATGQDRIRRRLENVQSILNDLRTDWTQGG